jgi:hypothetical protein
MVFPKEQPTMSRFVITVDFQLHPGAMREFLPLMVENANKSRDLEPGCERFDVLLPKDSADRVFLYEAPVYQGEEDRRIRSRKRRWRLKRIERVVG